VGVGTGIRRSPPGEPGHGRPAEGVDADVEGGGRPDKARREHRRPVEVGLDLREAPVEHRVDHVWTAGGHRHRRSVDPALVEALEEVGEADPAGAERLDGEVVGVVPGPVHEQRPEPAGGPGREDHPQPVVAGRLGPLDRLPVAAVGLVEGDAASEDGERAGRPRGRQRRHLGHLGPVAPEQVGVEPLLEGDEAGALDDRGRRPELALVEQRQPDVDPDTEEGEDGEGRRGEPAGGGAPRPPGDAQHRQAAERGEG